MKLSPRPSADDVDRNAGRVGADDGVGRRCGFDTFHQRLFRPGRSTITSMIQSLSAHGLFEIIFQIPQRDQVGAKIE